MGRVSGPVIEDIPYLALVEERAGLRSGPGIPPDLAWLEWPRPDGGALHVLVRRGRGAAWRTSILQTEPWQGPSDVERRLRGGDGGAAVLALPAREAAWVAFGAMCGDLGGLLRLAIGAEALARDPHVQDRVESWFAGGAAGMVELMFGPDATEAFADCAAGRILPEGVDLLTAQGAGGGELRELRRSHPLVARLALSSTLVVSALRAGAGLHEALALPCPGYVPAHLRRARGAVLSDIVAQVPLRGGLQPDPEDALRAARGTMRLAAALPPEWMPGTPASWTAFSTVARVLSEGPGFGPETLRRSKGDWEGLVARMARGAGVAGEPPRVVAQALCEEAGRLGDMRKWLVAQVLAPLVANAEIRHAFPPRGPGWEPDHPRDRLGAVADALLWRDRDVGSCLALGRSWGRVRDAIARSVSGVEEAGGESLRWDAPGGTARVGDVEVRPVADALSLWEEGAEVPDREGAAGLGHCVYGRLRLFRSGAAHCLSLRRAEDGRRLSTAQFEHRDGRPAVVEHRGYRNALPPPEAQAALEAYLASLPPPGMRSATGTVLAQDALWDLCGYDWRRTDGVGAALGAWAPLLPRWLRGLDADGAHAALVARRLLEPVG